LNAHRSKVGSSKKTSFQAEILEHDDGDAFTDPKTIVISEDGGKYHLQPFPVDPMEIDLHKVNPDGTREYLGVLTELDIETT